MAVEPSPAAMRLPVDRLFDLTNADFLNPQDFKYKCRASPSSKRQTRMMTYGTSLLKWTRISIFRCQFGWNRQERKDSGYPELLQTGIVCGILPFCFWETFSRKNHATRESLDAEKADFDRLFNDVLFESSEKLGKPLSQGHDQDANGHHYAIWRGKNGLLILQQSAHDTQFGLDMNFWVQSWKGADPQPDSPFITWLHNRTLIPPGVSLPEFWVACGPGLEKELEKEVALNPLHPLRGVKATSVARRSDTDDVLFRLHNHKFHLADVHLTWKREILPNWPSYGLYKSWTQWLADESHYE